MAITEFLARYWYIWVLLALPILWWFWTKQIDYSTRAKIKQSISFKNFWFLVIVFILGWVTWWKYGGSSTVKHSTFWVPLIGLVLLAGYNFIGKLMYATQQFKCPNFHGSYSNSPLRVNGFLLFAIDSFNAGGLSWGYAGRIVVVREETCEIMDEGAVSIARVYPAYSKQLHPDVENVIKNNKFFQSAAKKNKIFYGWFDNPSVVGEEDARWSLKSLKQLKKVKKNRRMFNLLKDRFNIDNPTPQNLLNTIRDLSIDVNVKGETVENVTKDKTSEAEHLRTQREIYGDMPERPMKIEGYEEGYS